MMRSLSRSMTDAVSTICARTAELMTESVEELSTQAVDEVEGAAWDLSAACTALLLDADGRQQLWQHLSSALPCLARLVTHACRLTRRRRDQLRLVNAVMTLVRTALLRTGCDMDEAVAAGPVLERSGLVHALMTVLHTEQAAGHARHVPCPAVMCVMTLQGILSVQPSLWYDIRTFPGAQTALVWALNLNLGYMKGSEAQVWNALHHGMTRYAL